MAHARALRALTLLAIALPLAGGVSGCSRPAVTDANVPRMKILVMDFEVSPGMKENPREIRGWWFGARTIYQNERAGEMFSDELNTRLARLPYVNLFPRVNLKYYFAEKRQRMIDAYAYLTDEEIDDLLEQISPLEYGRELGADKLLTGRIVRQYMSDQRTIHAWKSVMEVRCEMRDMASGEIEWSRSYDVTKRLASQTTLQEHVATLAVDDLRREYFNPMAVRAAAGGTSAAAAGTRGSAVAMAGEPARRAHDPSP